MFNFIKKNKSISYTNEIEWYKGMLIKEFKKINDEIFANPTKAEKAYGQFCALWDCNQFSSVS